MSAVIAIIIAYLLGSISSAILVAKALHLPDPRTEGSGNPGATNVLRTSGRKAGVLVLIGDLAKGLLAVLLAHLFGVEGFMLGLVAVAAVLGHVFPVYFGFKGGKGVATAIGGLLALSLWSAIVVLGVWLAVVLVFRYVSLASLVGAVAAPIVLSLLGAAAYALPALLIAAIIIWKHLPNIQRLRNGTESKVSL